MNSIQKSRELVVPKQKKTNLPVKFEKKLDVLNLVDKEIFLENRQEVKKLLPDILGRVLARIWIDPDFKEEFRLDPILTLNKYGVFLPDEMVLELQKLDTKRPKIIVYEKKEKSNFNLVKGSLKKLVNLIQEESEILSQIKNKKKYDCLLSKYDRSLESKNLFKIFQRIEKFIKKKIPLIEKKKNNKDYQLKDLLKEKDQFEL